MLTRALDDLDSARHWMKLLGHRSASAKVASFLLELSGRLSGQGSPLGVPDRFELPFGRQQIADILGLTIETTSRQLAKMRAEGVLDLPSRREIVINNRLALKGMMG